ncbi:MAG: sn-glycerol-3-phosphate transporter [Gammaproteobacteria bacterium]|nr:sn-glycerol-3-phosphate transporter [Gammaproteobacteria bacterium]MDH3413061.1 sn-glycerol-3-phosphate transporter [Gammaproteobacteria bacterium]
MSTISGREGLPRPAFARFALRLLLFINLYVPASWTLAADDSGNFLFNDEDRINLQIGGYVHYSPSDEHKGPPVYFGAEVQKPSRWIYGLGLFNNSFGQFSQYLYLGKQFNLTKVHEKLHIKLTGGIVYGYRGEHQDDIPVNFGNFAPLIIPSVGVHNDRWSADLVFLGTAALMLNIGYTISD